MASSDFEKFSGNSIVQQNLKKKAVRAAIFMGASQAADFILRFISTIILARILVPEDFGLIAMVTAVTGIAEAVRDMGLTSATIQRNNISHFQVSTLFWLNVLAGILLFTLFSLISSIISRFYNEPRLIAITIAIASNFIWSGLMIQHQALLSRQLKQGYMSLISFAANIVSIIAAVMLAINGYQYWSLIWREIIRNIINTGAIWLLCPWIPGLPKKNVGIMEFLRFGRDLSFTQLLNGLIAKIDGLLMGRFFGAVTLGIYRQAALLLEVPIQQINGPILSVAQPALSRLQTDPERYRRFYQKMLFFISVTTIPLGIFIGTYAKEITIALLGQKWIGVVPFIKIFSVLAAISPVIGTYTSVLISCGNSGKFLLISTVHSLVLMISMFIGIRFGPVGIAFAHVSTTVILMIPKLYFSFKGTPVSLLQFFRTLKAPVFAGLGMFTSLYLFIRILVITNDILSILCGAAFGWIIFFMILLSIPSGRKGVSELIKDISISAFRGNFARA